MTTKISSEFYGTHLPVVARVEYGNIVAEWENIGEGLCGDYDENEPEDINLLRFYAYIRDIDGDLIALDDASYCTRMPVDTDKEILMRALAHIAKEFYDHLDGNLNEYGMPEVSVKKTGECLSWVSPADFPMQEEVLL